MLKAYSIRSLTLPTVAVLSALCGGAWAEPGPNTGVAALEVKVLDAQPTSSPGQGVHDEVIYHMEVISVLRSDIRMKPGETIIVRAPDSGAETPDQGIRPRGWIGVAYLDPDPEAGSAKPGSRFVTAAGSDGLEDLPPTPPSLKWIEYRREDAR